MAFSCPRWGQGAGQHKGRKGKGKGGGETSPFTRTRLLPPNTLHLPAPLPAPLPSGRGRRGPRAGRDGHRRRPPRDDWRGRGRVAPADGVVVHDGPLSRASNRISLPCTTLVSVTVALSRLRVREGRLHSILIDRSTVKQRSPVRPQDALKANALECQGAKGPGPGRESLLLDSSFWFL